MPPEIESQSNNYSQLRVVMKDLMETQMQTHIAPLTQKVDALADEISEVKEAVAGKPMAPETGLAWQVKENSQFVGKLKKLTWAAALSVVGGGGLTVTFAYRGMSRADSMSQDNQVMKKALYHTLNGEELPQDVVESLAE